MFAHDTTNEEAIRFSRFDSTNPLSTVSHEFKLDGELWRSAEHYVYANLVTNPEIIQRIKNAETAQEAYKLGKAWYRRKHANWKTLRRVLMTRALYTKAMMYPEIKQALLETGNEKIIETSLYDHYWGIGRDQRGVNMLGKVWEDIRNKILEDADKR